MDTLLKNSLTSQTVFFPYLLEIDIVDSFSTNKYVDNISILLKRLWDNKYPVIVAADFENLLSEAGGYKSTNVPFPASIPC
ncbi:hypothetical protein J2I47_25915 [Fibrella sp. HMF5335]|uniref:Uncharacterized protein n=1 Tax=Fibrella rubiginis TaxID=2817060 RepID=A0A939GP25_9BACT|nr:hypothetical protein [Fibrella rubiginis]MBO0940008.1 hypothetical protein [Fibrella rubiginis]